MADDLQPQQSSTATAQFNRDDALPLERSLFPQPLLMERYQQSMFDQSRAGLQQAFGNAIESGFRKPTRWERGQQIGQDIYRNLAAPMVGIFGPRGFETGTAEWIKSEQDRQDKLRSSKNQARSQSIDALKGLADIMSHADKSRMNEFAEMTNYFKMMQLLPFQMQSEEWQAKQRRSAAGENDAQTENIKARTKTEDATRSSKALQEYWNATEAQQKARKVEQDIAVGKERERKIKEDGSLVATKKKTEEAKEKAQGALAGQRTARKNQIEKTPIKNPNATKGGAVKKSDLTPISKVGRERQSTVSKLIRQWERAGADEADIVKALAARGYKR